MAKNYTIIPFFVFYLAPLLANFYPFTLIVERIQVRLLCMGKQAE